MPHTGIWADFVCPACYLAKPRTGQAIAASGHADAITITYRSPSCSRRRPEPVDSFKHVLHNFGGDQDQAARLEEHMARILALDPPPPAGIRLVAFDLALTRGLTCMEAIADALGFADQMAAWEQARTEQELIAARLGMWEYLKHGSSLDITAAIAGIPLAPGAADGIAALRAAGIRTRHRVPDPGL